VNYYRVIYLDSSNDEPHAGVWWPITEAAFLHLDEEFCNGVVYDIETLDELEEE
jgi:hypothetical protein